MKILPRTQFGNPILRQHSKKVSLSSLKTSSFKKLIKQMIFTMRRSGGVGLAAPQIGKSLQIVVMETRPSKTRPKLKKKGPIVIINPKIVKYSKNKEKDWEGCLSLQGVRGHVPRAKEITVEYLDVKGENVREVVRGFWARIFQHEIDHLNGNVYVDRMEDMTTLMTFTEFKKRILKKK